MIAVIDLGGTNTKYGLVESGKIIVANSIPAEPQGGLEKHLNKVVELIDELCKGFGKQISDCHGIGLLSTGLVNNKDMLVLSTNEKYNDAKGFDFKNWALKKTGLKLRMENDAKGALLGEYHYGAGRGSDNVMMITFGTGIGTAVISEGKLLTGSNFSGGNLGGHILVRSGGRKCTCGARGCLEAEASGWALPIIAKEHLLFSTSSLKNEAVIGFKEMLEHAEQGDECAIDLRRHCFQIWGEALVSYIHLFDPSRIILGGGLMNSANLALPRLERTIKEMTWTHGKGLELFARHPRVLDVGKHIERAAWLDARDARQRVQPIDDDIPALAKGGHHLAHASLRTLDRRDSRVLGRCGGARVRVGHQARHGGGELLRHDAIAQTPTRHGIGLGEAMQDDGPLRCGHARVGGHAGELALIQDVLIHLVGKDGYVALGAHLGDRLQVAILQHAPRGVLWRVEHDERGSVRDQVDQLVDVETKAALFAQGHGHAFGAHIVDHRLIDRKARVRVDDLAARLAQRHDGEKHDGLGARCDDDLLRRDMVPTLGIDVLSDRLA